MGAETRTVDIVEVSPRDGLQNEDVVLDVDDKVRLVELAVAAGARRIEVTAFVHPRRVPQMADAEQVMAGVPRIPGVRYSGLALNGRGVERALQSSVDEVNLVVVATETFNRRNQGRDVAESMAAFRSIASTVLEAGVRLSLTIGASFGCPFEGEVPRARVIDLALQAEDLGVAEVSFADTIGVAVPDDVHRLLADLRATALAVPLRMHLHDTRATGIANAQAALEGGVTALDASLGGIGGCPFAPAATGNIASEDLLYLLDRSGWSHGWDLDAVAPAVQHLERCLGRSVPGMFTKAGGFPSATVGSTG